MKFTPCGNVMLVDHNIIDHNIFFFFVLSVQTIVILSARLVDFKISAVIFMLQDVAVILAEADGRLVASICATFTLKHSLYLCSCHDLTFPKPDLGYTISSSK